MVSQSGQIFGGRQREMETLTAALDAALSGRGQIVMLAGEPGIGKTRTAQELAGLADRRGARGGRATARMVIPAPIAAVLQPLEAIRKAIKGTRMAGPRELIAS